MKEKSFVKVQLLMAYDPNTDESGAVSLPTGAVRVAARPGCGCWTDDLPIPGCVSGTGRCPCSPT